MKKITKLPAHLVKGGSGARAAEQSLGLFSVTGYTVFHSENTHSSQCPVFVFEFPAVQSPTAQTDMGAGTLASSSELLLSFLSNTAPL